MTGNVVSFADRTKEKREDFESLVKVHLPNVKHYHQYFELGFNNLFVLEKNG